MAREIKIAGAGLSGLVAPVIFSKLVMGVKIYDTKEGTKYRI
jgi:hypothetical protein